MAPRSGIIAGKTVIVVQVQESIDSALNSISSKLNKFSAKIGRLGLEMFSGGLLGGLVGKQIVDQFKEFEDRILFLRTKLTATARDFSILEERIRELGRSTSFTASEVAEGATVLAQAGLNAKEAAQTLQATLDLARGAQIELGQAGAILVNTMRSFSMETSRANEVASQFIAAARLGTLDVLDLKESIKEVLGTVRTLNIDLPTTLALLTQMAERSLKGTKAGTSLNTALLNLASKSKQLKENLGITLPDNINGEGFIDFLETLYSRINRLGNLQRVAILQQLFNIRGGRAITALDDIGKIVRLQKAIRSAGDEARKAAVIMDSGLGGSIRIAISALESLSITIGKLVSKQLKPIIDTIPAIANSFEQLATKNEMLVIGLAATPPLLLGIGAGLLTISFIGAKAAAIIGGLAISFRSIAGGAITALNGQLVLLTQTMNTFFGRVRREGKGAKLDKKGGLFQQFDELLSAKLLSPQKVGGRGRNAQKTRPTSFFGRVGSAEIKSIDLIRKGMSGIATVINRIGTGSTKGISLLLRLSNPAIGEAIFRNSQKAFSLIQPSKYSQMMGKISSTINTVSRNIVNLKSAISSVNTEISTGISRLNKYNALSARFAKGAVESIAAQDRQVNLQNRLNAVTQEFNALIAAPVEGKRTKAAKQQEKDRVRRIALLGAERQAIKSQLDVEVGDIDTMAKKSDYYKALATQEAENIGNLKKKRTGFVTSLKLQQKELSLANKQRTTLVSARKATGARGTISLLDGIKSGTLNALRSVGSILSKTFSSLGKTLVTAFRNIPKLLDTSITGMFRFFKAAGGFAAGLFRIANGIRRFVFSLSGILTIVELLILFGPKIGFIRDAFARLGKGFGDAFQTISGTLKDLAPAFNLIGTGFGNIFKGEGELGVQGLVDGFGKLATIVKSNLTIAFFQVVEAVAPLYDFLKNIVLSLLEVFNLLGSIAGITFNNVAGGVNALTGGGAGGFLEGVANAIKQAFSRENIKAAFTFVGAFFIELARGIQNIMKNIFIVINDLSNFIQNAIVRLFAFIGGGLADAAAGLSGGGFSGILKEIFADLSNAASGVANSLMPQLDAAKLSGDKILEGFMEGDKALDKTFTGFVERLGQIFGVDTEANAQKAQDLAFADKIIAMRDADEAARIDAAGNTPARRFGTLLGNLFNGTIIADGIVSGVKGAAPFIGKNQVDWLKLGTDIFEGAKGELLARLADKPVAGGVPPATLADIVSATVGTFQSTRNNLLRVAGGKSVDQQQLDAMNQIVTNTGGPGENLFSLTRDLSKRAQPFVFQ